MTTIYPLKKIGEMICVSLCRDGAHKHKKLRSVYHHLLMTLISAVDKDQF